MWLGYGQGSQHALSSLDEFSIVIIYQTTCSQQQSWRVTGTGGLRKLKQPTILLSSTTVSSWMMSSRQPRPWKLMSPRRRRIFSSVVFDGASQLACLTVFHGLMEIMYLIFSKRKSLGKLCL
jgi:hypothetical protein